MDNEECLVISFLKIHQICFIEPPAEVEYKPFASTEEALEAIKKHGGWIKSKDSKSYSLAVSCDKESVDLGGNSHIKAAFVLDMNDLFK